MLYAIYEDLNAQKNIGKDTFKQFVLAPIENEEYTTIMKACTCGHFIASFFSESEAKVFCHDLNQKYRNMHKAYIEYIGSVSVAENALYHCAQEYAKNGTI
jgi:hypothetical protein